MNLRVLATAGAAHRGLPLPTRLAARTLGRIDESGPELLLELEGSGLGGQILAAAFTQDRDAVDRAAGHPCAAVRVASAANRTPTTRLYDLASDPCRDVALAALANRPGQELMTKQFRGALEVAGGYPLSACPCGARTD